MCLLKISLKHHWTAKLPYAAGGAPIPVSRSTTSNNISSKSLHSQKRLQSRIQRVSRPQQLQQPSTCDRYRNLRENMDEERVELSERELAPVRVSRAPDDRARSYHCAA